MGDSLIAVYRDYQMDPAFHRLRETGAAFHAGGINLDADLVFVWDKPTPTGQLGSLLEATQIPVEDVFVTCLLKYGTLASHAQAWRDSKPYLRREMKFLHPKVICPLGQQALSFFAKDAPPWPLARGREYRTRAGTPVVPVEYLADLDSALKSLPSKEFRPRG